MISQPVGTFGPPRSAPAGWYPDPYGGAYARYFDGYRWTPYVAPRTGVAASPSAATRQPHPELPLPMAIGAIVILAASLIASRELLDCAHRPRLEHRRLHGDRRRRRLRAVGAVDVVRQPSGGGPGGRSPTSACASAGSISAGVR